MSEPTLQTFYVRFDTDFTTPAPIQARHRIDAAVRLMQAQPSKWRERVERVSVQVYTRLDEKPTVLKCTDVQKHFPRARSTSAHENTQDTFI